jgi:hypothetical protein
MARVSDNRDELFASSGYVRVSLVAVLLRKTVSGTSRWATKNNIASLCEFGVKWLSWRSVRSKCNETKDVEGKGLADIQKMPTSAISALSAIRALLAQDHPAVHPA